MIYIIHCWHSICIGLIRKYDQNELETFTMNRVNHNSKFHATLHCLLQANVVYQGVLLL